MTAISASARWLLLARAHSGRPYAREAAELLFGADEVAAAATPRDEATAIRRRHFEVRTRSIDEALDRLGVTRVLELAAGLSFRGLARTGDIDYLETDLPDIVELKRSLLAKLAPPPGAGRYRIEPLDVLDEEAFAAAVASLRPGPLAIANEGLLMYLDADAKTQLASNIRAALGIRGGHWITADIYLRGASRVARPAEVERFLAEHRVEDNKFASWDDAAAFFTGEGFTIVDRIAPPHHALARETWILALRDTLAP